MLSLSLLLLGSFTCFGTGCGACPTCADSVLRVLPVLLFFFANILLNFLLFVSFVYFFFFYYMSLPNVFPGGLCKLDT